MKKILAVPILGVGLSMPFVTWGGDFPAAGVDQPKNESLGQFIIVLEKEMGQKFGIDGCPDTPNEIPWNLKKAKQKFPEKCFIISPVLHDKDTKIGRSARHFDGNNTDLGGATVPLCETCDIIPSTVKDKDFSKVPNNDTFKEGPIGTSEVHTQIISFHLKDDNSANAVRAGNAAPAQPSSIGEVESLQQKINHSIDATTAEPVGDFFPAQSFFNIFVEVDLDLPPYGNIDMVLYNKPNKPLVIQNGELKSFPPTVVYVHERSQRVAVYVRSTVTKIGSVSITIEEETLVGWIMIAGHGLDISEDDFVDIMERLNITLDSFTANAKNDSVKLKWKTGTEKDNAGFKVWRGQSLDGTCSNDPNNYVDVQLITPLMASQGTEVSGTTYTMKDSNVASGNTYCYVLEDIDYDGKSTFHLDNIVSATP